MTDILVKGKLGHRDRHAQREDDGKMHMENTIQRWRIGIFVRQEMLKIAVKPPEARNKQGWISIQVSEDHGPAILDF